MNEGFRDFSRARHLVWQSKPFTFAAGDSVTLRHNLGQVPTSARVMLVNVTAEDGYVPGDQVDNAYWHIASATDANVPPAITVRRTKTALVVDIHSTAGQIRSVNAGTHATVTPTVANWKLVAYAELNLPNP